MKITFNKEVLIENTIVKITQEIETLQFTSQKELTELIPSQIHYTQIERYIYLANLEVKRLLLHLLNLENENYSNSSIEFEIRVEHPLHQTALPFQIEDYIICYVTEKWLEEHGIKPTTSSQTPLSQIKSTSLLKGEKVSRNYRLF